MVEDQKHGALRPRLQEVTVDGAWRGARLRSVAQTPGGYVGQAALDRTSEKPAKFVLARA